jgi:type IV pilus assembly protein PilM
MSFAELDFLQRESAKKKASSAQRGNAPSQSPIPEDRFHDFLDLEMLSIRREPVLEKAREDKNTGAFDQASEFVDSPVGAEAGDFFESSAESRQSAVITEPAEGDLKDEPDQQDQQEPALHAEPSELLESSSDKVDFESLVVPGTYSFEKTSSSTGMAPPLTAKRRDQEREAKKKRASQEISSTPLRGGRLDRARRGLGRLLRNFFASLQGNLAVGLDLGSRYLKYVAMSKTRSGYQLEDYDCVEMRRLPAEMSEEEKEKLVAEQVRAFLSSKPLRNCWITSAISGLNVLFRYHLLPHMPKKDLAEAVPWATRKDLPFPVESALIDYVVLGERKEDNAVKLEVAAVATPAAVVNRHLAQLKNNHLTPQKVSTVTAALWNLVIQKKEPASKNIMVVDIGALSTHILFVESGRLLFVREITTAGDEFTEALTSTVYTEGHNVTLSPAEAEHLKQEYGLPNADDDATTESGIPFSQIAVLLRPAVERFVNEIRRSIDYYREKFKAEAVQQILITGGGARLQHFAQALAKELGVAVEVLDPLQFVSLKKFQRDDALYRLAPQFAVAVGLALDRRKELNLLPPALKGAFRLRAAQKYFRYTALFGLIAIVCVTGFEYFRSQQFTNDLKRLQFEYSRLLPRRDQYAGLSRQRDELQQNLDAYQSRISIRLTAPDHLRALSNLIPASLVLTSVTIETMPNDTKKDEGGDEYIDFIVINGIVLPASDRDSRKGAKEGVALADFLIDLEKAGYFRSIDLRDQKQQPDGSIKFTLACFF